MWWRGKARIIFCGGKEENDDALNGESEGIGVLREQSGSVRGSEHRLARSGPVRHRPFSSSQQRWRRRDTVLGDIGVRQVAQTPRFGGGRGRHSRLGRRHPLQQGLHHDAARNPTQKRLRYPQSQLLTLTSTFSLLIVIINLVVFLCCAPHSAGIQPPSL